MPGQGKDIPGGSLFHDLSGVHHGDLIRQFRHDSQVMGDQEDGHSRSVPEFPEQVEDLGLDGHVEGGGRLIGHQEPWLGGESHGDHDPLLHSSRKTVGVLAQPLFRSGNSHRPEKTKHLGVRVRLGAMKGEDFPDLGSNPHPRIQRSGGILEDVGHHPAPNGSQRAFPQGADLLSLHLEASGENARLRDEPGDHLCRDAFAAAAFPHQSQDLPGSDRQGYPVHDHKAPCARRQVNLEVLEFEKA